MKYFKSLDFLLLFVQLLFQTALQLFFNYFEFNFQLIEVILFQLF